jgi:hypothetical protein
VKNQVTPQFVKNQVTSPRKAAPCYTGSSQGQHDKQFTRETSNSVAATTNKTPKKLAAKTSTGLHTKSPSWFISQKGNQNHCLLCTYDDSSTMYCSINCQEKHWQEHKKHLLLQTQSKPPPKQKKVGFNFRQYQLEQLSKQSIKETSTLVTSMSPTLHKKLDTNPSPIQQAKHPSWAPQINCNEDSAQDNNYDNKPKATITSRAHTSNPQLTVKFSFKPKLETTNTRLHIARCHYECLQAMSSIDTQAIDKNGSPMLGNVPLPSMLEYEKHYTLHFSPGNLVQNRGPLYTIYHRIQSNMSLGNICKQAKVSAILNKHKAKINLHIWKEDEIDIVNLGFHIGVDPSNQLKTHFETDIRRQITHTTGTPPEAIPYFQSGYSRPFHNNSTSRSVTQSYNLQCHRADAKEMISLLKATYKNDNRTFIFHKLRHVDPSAYKKAIDQQNDFLTNSRAIPIHGISAELMSVIEHIIRDLDGIHSIQRHKNTSTTGRWNLMTTTNHFQCLISKIKKLLPTLDLIYGEETTQNLSFPPIGLAFNKQATVHNKPTRSLNPAAPVFNSLQNNASPINSGQYPGQENGPLSVKSDLKSPPRNSSDINGISPDNTKHPTNNSVSQTISTCASSTTSSCNLPERALSRMRVPTEIEIKHIVIQVLQSLLHHDDFDQRQTPPQSTNHTQTDTVTNATVP